MTRLLKLLFFPILVLSTSLQARPDIKIIKSDRQTMILEWQLTDFKKKDLIASGEVFQQLSFYESVNDFPEGFPDIPQKVITIGIPSGGGARVQLLANESETLSQINLAPVFTPYKDKSGIDNYKIKKDLKIYEQSRLFPESILAKSEPSQFRDIPIQRIYLRPFQYNPATGSLTVYKKIRLKITYSNPNHIYRTFSPRGKLDQLYSKMLLNFDQAQHWQLPRNRMAAEKTDIPDGPFYRIPVSQDGLYKITVSVMQNAGIDVDNLGIHDLKMFNNGGHMLSYTTNAAQYNPLYTQQIPIHIVDQNSDGFLNENDYILFYGKALNGWYFDMGRHDFIYQKHLYANANFYWLTISPGNGLRMEEQEIGTLNGTTQIEYFLDRYHFEEDKYNLLASGPDWYGERFFGRSDSYSLNFTIHPYLQTSERPTFKLEMKGGSGVFYGDDEYYVYTFSATLNNKTLAKSFSFSRASERLVQGSVSEPLVDGKNIVNFQYTGNLDGCTAYLDWFELKYPRGFEAENNQLSFYTRSYENNQRYSITGLESLNDFIIFDISNAVQPVILGQNKTPVSGALTFDLPASAEPQNIFVSSLSSSQIKTVEALLPVERRQNLISTANQADYLIITHKTFIPFAQQMARKRPGLSTKVVTMEDIYFDFNSGVPDPTALRNFIRYAYANWQEPAPSYVLLFGDGHYDYRNIALNDTMRVPTFEIFNLGEVNSRATDNYFTDLNMTDPQLVHIDPDLAIGRIPIESIIDAERYLQKFDNYENSPDRGGWQMTLTFVADDAEKPGTTTEWEHQNQTEDMATLPELRKFIENKIYLSTYPSEPGGFGRVKPKAGNALIDALNQGTLIVNYVGHGSPVQWAHEGVFVMSRDLDRIQNSGRLTFLIAATCDFGKFDDPRETSFNEALIWKEGSGTIAALASTRLVYSTQNAAFNKLFYRKLFPNGAPSVSLGEAKLLATGSSINDQKYVLFADPTMHLADPRGSIRLVSNLSDSLKALSEVKVEAVVTGEEAGTAPFNGDAIIIVNDAAYDSVSTGGKYRLITEPGPSIFKGQVSVINDTLRGEFIVPKTIRYYKKPSGRITFYAWDRERKRSASGYNDQLLFNGSLTNSGDDSGPQLDIYFEDQENFASGDLILPAPTLLADIEDEKGINISGATGHNITITIDDQAPKNISGFFTYNKDSHTKGQLRYPLDKIESGMHTLTLVAFDNLNNASTQTIDFNISASSDLIVEDVVNYPNPFSGSTVFTFQTNRQGAEVTIKIYTISGRLIQPLEGFTTAGFNKEISWDGRDQDGDRVANGVYLYKLIVKEGSTKTEKIEKMVLTR